MSRKFTGRMTVAELAGAVAYAFANNKEFLGECSVADCNYDPIKFLKENRFYSVVTRLTPEVEKDLKKVNFCDENVEWEKGEGLCGCEKITGFHTLSNGLTCLGVTAAGDWETPLFYIIYWSGLELRAYIPIDGNFWNTDTKTAYGSEEDCAGVTDGEKAADENVKKRFGVKSLDQLGDIDTKVVWADIVKRIQPAEGKFIKPKGMGDIDWKKIEQEAAKEEPMASGNSAECVLDVGSSTLRRVDNALPTEEEKHNCIDQTTIIMEDFFRKPFSIDSEVDDIDIWMQATRDKILALKGRNASDVHTSLVALINGDMRSILEKLMRMMNNAGLESKRQ